jgi:hypothetical protein
VSKPETVQSTRFGFQWPWVLAAILVGLVSDVLMPPLVLVLLVLSWIWGFMQSGNRTLTGRRSWSVLFGVAVAAALYGVLVIVSAYR